MSMRLSPEDLIKIAHSVLKLEETGVEVSQFKSVGHVVYLDRVDNQVEGTHYQIRGIACEASANRQTSVNRR